DILRRGGLVAFPTETVYGLGANARDDQAVAGIFQAKGRPRFNPLIIHYASSESAFEDVASDALAASLARSFWPGPMALILPRAADCTVSRLASAGLPTLAVRVPDHPVARELIERAGCPLAAPSANRSGRISPTTPEQVATSLGQRVGIILAGGACRVGLESTVIDLSGPAPVILRPGAITPEAIETAIGVAIPYAEHDDGDDKQPRSPGLTLRHYAPRARLRLEATDLRSGEALLAFGDTESLRTSSGRRLGEVPDQACLNLSPAADLTEAAANLFRMLDTLDAEGHELIAVMPIPQHGLGRAINDRLRRGAAGADAGETPTPASR
ncbi:MAG: L-threonylcarbamoyladenylate synthase, partial [Wenzhouxiangella sp.]|nr:L-threonylcarbamoyladenylate synthase [Wenzhouxiangella sp.]